MGKKQKICLLSYSILMCILFLATIFMDIYKNFLSANYVTVANIINILNYAKIVLSFILIVLLICFKVENKNKYLYCFAFIFNLLADYFLSIAKTKNVLCAVILFCFVQIFYCVIIFRECDNKKVDKTNIVVRSCLLIFGECVLILGFKSYTNELFIVTIFYAINLVSNVIFSFFNQNKKLAVGLTFFLLCDIFAGLTAGVSMGLFTIDNAILKIFTNGTFDMSWLFYSICQYFLAISIVKKITTK